MGNKLKFYNTNIDGLYTIEINMFKDIRGDFGRLFCAEEFKEIGLEKNIVNVNYSKTIHKGDVRGMHYQKSPYEEVKIVKCIRGSIYDVAIDMRESSPTYLQHFSITLSEDNNKMLYIPEGFAHGFQALSDNAEIIYFNTQFYNPQSEGGVNAKDQKINIQWPLQINEQSQKDKDIKFLN